MNSRIACVFTVTIAWAVSYVTPVIAFCAVDDIDFTSGGGGCKDSTTGLVWSSDTLPVVEADYIGIHFSNANYFCTDIFSGHVDRDGDGQPDSFPEAEGYTDWRAPTVREVLTALDNGLATHLDYSYEDGVQLVDGTPRWTQCTARKKGLTGGFAVDHTNGTFSWHQTIPGAFNEELLCVRGAIADLSQDCPNSKGDLPSGDGGSSGGKGKNKNALILPRSLMGSVLVLPAMVAGGFGYLRRRR